MRKAATATTLLLLALAALSAAKPVPPDDLPGSATQRLLDQAWRTRGVPVCVARLHEDPALSPDDLEGICGCAFDTYLQGHGTEPLPGIEGDHVPLAMEQQLLGCSARTRPDQAAAVARLSATWPPARPPIAATPGADAPKPTDQADVSPPTESRESGASGGGFLDWVGSISLPAWLTGASALWWVALGIFLFGLLVLKVRRRDPRRDLTGPPSSMPQRPRRPDLPR